MDTKFGTIKKVNKQEFVNEIAEGLDEITSRI